MADLQDGIQTKERRVAEIRSELEVLDAEAVPEEELEQALEAFDPVWTATEQTRVLRALSAGQTGGQRPDICLVEPCILALRHRARTETPCPLAALACRAAFTIAIQ